MCADDYCQRVKAARAAIGAMSRAAGDASVKAYLPTIRRTPRDNERS